MQTRTHRHPAFPPLFLRFVLADSLIQMSMAIGLIVLPWLIARRGGAHDLAIYASSIGLMSLLAMPLLAPLGDRLSRQKLISGGLALYAAESLLLACFTSRGYYRLPLFIALEAAGVVCVALVTPILYNVPAELVPARQLTAALGLQKGNQAIGRFVGPVCAGVLLGSLGLAAGLWFHALLLLVACLLTRRLGLAPQSAGQASLSGWRRWRQDLLAGARANWQIPLERGWTLVNFVSAFFMLPAVGMLVPLKVASLGLSGVWLASCEAGLAIGMLLGSFWLSAWLIERWGRYRVRVMAGLALGLTLTLAGLARSGWVMLLAFGLSGIANATVLLIGVTHRTLARPAGFRARLSGYSLTLNQIAAAVGPALAGLALTRWPVASVYAGFGLLAAVSAGAIVLVKGFGEFIRLDHAEVENWFGRHYPQVFAGPGNPDDPPRT